MNRLGTVIYLAFLWLLFGGLVFVIYYAGKHLLTLILP